jgi:hypothetical protein
VRNIHDADGIDMTLCQRLRVLIGTIVLLQEPLSIPSLALLLDVHIEDLRRDARALTAVLHIGPDTDSFGAPLVRIFHPSFRTFILEHCHSELFSIKEPVQHRELALYCLRNLNATLRHDICEIKNPTLANINILSPSVSMRIQAFVPEATRYACQFWVIHLSKSEAPDRDLLSTMQMFAMKHLFHWVELLSLTEHVFIALLHLPEVDTWCKVSQFHPVEWRMTFKFHNHR